MSFTNLGYIYVILRRERLNVVLKVFEQIGVEVEQVRPSSVITEGFPGRRPNR